MSTKIIKFINILSFFTRAFAFYLLYINSSFDFDGAIHYSIELPFVTAIIVGLIVIDYIGFKHYKNHIVNKFENKILPT